VISAGPTAIALSGFALILSLASSGRGEETIRYEMPDGRVLTLSRDDDGAIRIKPPPPTAQDEARAVDARVQAALRNAATSMEAYAVDHNDSYEGATLSNIPDFAHREDAVVSILEATRTHFKLRAQARGGTGRELDLGLKDGEGRTATIAAERSRPEPPVRV